MSRKKRKANSLVKELVKEMPLSGPPPDEGLTTIGLDMEWFPPGYKPIKKELNEDEDPMLNIL